MTDSIPDCSLGEDESYFYLTRFHFHSESKCSSDKYFPCFLGDTKCFALNELCIYELQPFSKSILRFCRNGRHLANCTSFDCPSHFKCPGYYCIPWTMVCNGKYDCPYAEDESLECTGRSCSNMFKCKESSSCLHFGSVCNGETDCPLGDDEKLCEIPSCPWKCRCLHYAITCERINTVTWSGNKPFIHVNITNSTLMRAFLQQFTAVTIIYLRRNNIKSFCILGNIQVKFIKTIDMSHNIIPLLQKRCIQAMNRLFHLNLSYNLLTDIPLYFSQLFVNLELIDISHNSFTIISSEFMSKFKQLKAINILQKEPLSFDVRFEKAYVSLVITNDFHACCMTSKETICTSNSYGFFRSLLCASFRVFLCLHKQSHV